ncbi:hypothetical protein DICPUDRAFT_80925 [Dictyostelium purpureum]|uniref:G-patch domain-containing protein n=1 Tax=Dictyostelium purpureum TaxID=5786 RepID=F0ZRY5_DICPU|nr:uncharacterized protein DICPUDRAFT_80925 [Dictyostelium purpureum]EGC33277.1 hypothetical protein DICPUDRAFT_80925 [Dictyostelium purpureum]|eukprot:XP_003290178.1 hypothetical protein DICPUDRAFT_80925 [Dictyostelium purpureum]
MNYQYDEDDNEENFQQDINKKKKRKFTKEDSIYGVFNDGWGDYEDDEDNLNEEEYYKMKKRYQTPVGFVASGIYEPNSSKNKKEDNSNDDETDNNNNEKKEKKIKKEKKQSKKQTKKKFNKEEEDESLENKKVGGIGAMLLSKMGYSGSGGLGKGGTGMVEPIKVFVRPKNAGLSSVAEINNDKVNQTSSEDEDSSDDDDNSDDENKRSLGWKKKEKLKYDFDEHLSYKPQKQQKEEPKEKQIIIDMSGPETKLINNFKELNKQQKNQQQQNQNIKPLSEFKFNVELLLKFKELEIDNTNSKIKFERERIENLKRGQEKLNGSIENDNKKINSINEIIKLIEEQKQSHQQQKNQTYSIESLREVLKFFEILKFKFNNEYQQFQLYKLEKELIEPPLKSLVSNWNIESDPIYLLKQVKKLSTIFINQENNNNGYINNNDIQNLNNYYFLLIIRNIFLPKFKQFFRNQWNVKNPIIAATLISKWSNVLPEVCQEILLEQSILPKLKVEIEKWDPLTDPIPIHHWLLPWIPFLKEELKVFFPSIRQKIISGLVDWDPSDESAYEILVPWRDVFESNTIQSILNRFIIPKLKNSISTIQFLKHPQDNANTEIDNLIKWKEFMGLDTIISIVDKEFFNNWVQFIFNWLNESNPNFEEISNWYSFWKTKIPDEIKQIDTIKSKLSIAINLMKKSMKNEIININDYNIILNNHYNPNNNNNNNNNINNNTNNNTNDTNISNISHSNDLNNLSMKQMIEKIAINNGLLFLPSQKKNDKGQQIYTFDKYSIIIEKDLILLNNNGKWEPANIQLLLNNCIENKK